MKDANHQQDALQKIADLERQLEYFQKKLKMQQEKPATVECIPLANDGNINFVANLSHELLTPMNAIKGLMELALDIETTPKLKNYLEQVMVSCHQLYKIIDELLAVVALAKGEYQLKRETFSLKDLLESAVSGFENSAREKGLKLNLVMPAELDGRVIGDSHALTVVLTHLLDNAVKFTENGKIVLRAERTVTQSGKLGVNIFIDDSGIGIDPDRQQDVFKPFFQADSSSTRHYQGIGLGLAISQQVVVMMGGQITLVSQPGQGTSVCIAMEFRSFHKTDHAINNDTEDSLAVEPAGHDGVNAPQNDGEHLPGAKPVIEIALSAGETARFGEVLVALRSCLMEGDHYNAERALVKINTEMPVLAAHGEFRVLQQQVLHFDFADALATLDAIALKTNS